MRASHASAARPTLLNQLAEPMSDETGKFTDEMRKIQGELQTLRDEVRVKLHLGAMEARDAFAGIEHDIEHAGTQLTQSSRRMLEQARARLKKLADDLRAPAAPPQ
jgi:hypothetical protein